MVVLGVSAMAPAAATVVAADAASATVIDTAIDTATATTAAAAATATTATAHVKHSVCQITRGDAYTRVCVCA